MLYQYLQFMLEDPFLRNMQGKLRQNANPIGEQADRCAKYSVLRAIHALSPCIEVEVTELVAVNCKKKMGMDTWLWFYIIWFSAAWYISILLKKSFSCTFFRRDHSQLPSLEHCSGVVYVSACNCGRKQGPREDPFSMRTANYDFYTLLGKDCGCSDLESIAFPVFTPSTKDFR